MLKDSQEEDVKFDDKCHKCHIEVTAQALEIIGASGPNAARPKASSKGLEPRQTVKSIPTLHRHGLQTTQLPSLYPLQDTATEIRT